MLKRKGLSMVALLSILLISSSLFASDKCLDPTQEMRSIPGRAIHKGPLKGQCLATDEGRPIELVEKNNQILVLNQFQHNNEFVTASVDLSDIQDAIFQLEKFPPEWLAAHTQLRIRFKTPSVQLFKNGKALGSVRDLIITNEALGVKGFVYNLVPGAMNNYVILTRITSLDEKIRTMITRDRHTVKQIKLNLTVPEIKKLIEDTLVKAKEENWDVMYNTLTKNCATDIFMLINQSLENRSIPNYYETISFLPIMAPKILKDSGLIDEEMIDLNAEIANK